MKKNNPHTPIMLREALNTEPTVFARYGEIWSLTRIWARANALAEYGKEKRESLSGRVHLDL